MELRQELKMHVVNMKSLLKTAKDFRPIWQWLVMIICAVVIYAVGFVNGIHTELREGSSRNQTHNAVWRMMETQAEAKGDSLITERFRRRTVDDAVADYAERMQRPQWRQTAFNFLYANILQRRLAQEQELELIRRIAEQRLALLPKPSPETVEAFRRRGIADKISSMEQQYEKTATAYSQLLGREIKSIELVTNSELRAHLKQLENEREMRGG